MISETIITCDECNEVIEGFETYDRQIKRVKLDFNKNLRSIFVRTASGETLEHYDFCLKCADKFIAFMDSRDKLHGNPTSVERKLKIEKVKEQDKKRQEDLIKNIQSK